MTFTGPYHSTPRLEVVFYDNISNHGPLLVIHEFHTDLLHIPTRTSATEHFRHTGVPGWMLFDVDYHSTVRSKPLVQEVSGVTGGGDGLFVFLFFGLLGLFRHFCAICAMSSELLYVKKLKMTGG